MYAAPICALRARVTMVALVLALGLAWRHTLAAQPLQLKQQLQEGTGYLPIVMWHGMGDSCYSQGSMGAVAARIKQALPGVFVHSVCLGSSGTSDVLHSYFGSLNDQVDMVCNELLGMRELQAGYVGIGFSQGGQFLRAVVQRCQQLGPPMHSLVTMGAQHQGVVAVPGCLDPGPSSSTHSLYCKIMQGLIGRSAYSWWVQGHIVQAQYIKDPHHLDLYLQRSAFLADINNEVAARRRAQYRANLASLSRLVLLQFDDDDMVVPKESSHFAWFNGSQVVPLREQPLYAEDWIGLRQLDQEGRLHLIHKQSLHMQFSLDWFEQEIVRPYLAVPATQGARLRTWQ